MAAGDDADLDRLVDGTNEALEALRELTRGVFPTQLARSGLEPTLRSLFARSGAGAELTVDGTGGRRFPPRVEAAVYFCCVEAVRAGAGPVSVSLSSAGDDLVLRIVGADDGIDLQGVTDRIEAVGGELSAGDGLLVLTIPVVVEPEGAESVAAGGPGGAVPGG